MNKKNLIKSIQSAATVLLLSTNLCTSLQAAEGLILAPGALPQTVSGKQMLFFLDKGRTVSLEVTPQAGTTYVHTFAANMPQVGPTCTIQQWAPAMRTWVPQCASQRAITYSYVYGSSNGTITLTQSNAARLPHTFTFAFTDDVQNHRTTLSLTRSFMDGTAKQNLPTLTTILNHTATPIADIPKGTIFHFDGTQVYEPVGKKIRYDCPAVPNSSPELSIIRPMGEVPQYTMAGNSLNSLALKQLVTPSELTGMTGSFRKISTLQQESPFVYSGSDGASLVMTRRYTTVCQSMESNDIMLTFNYIVPTDHRLVLKSGYSVTTATAVQFPRGLYQLQGNRWTLVNKDFTTDPNNSFEFKAPTGEQTYFQEVAFKSTDSNAQIIQDVRYATSYLTILNLSGRADFTTQELVDLGVVIGTMPCLDALNLGKSGPASYSGIMQAVAAKTTLRHLNLDGANLDVAAFGRLASLVNLVDLSAIGQKAVTGPAALTALRPLSRLTKLNLSGCELIPAATLSGPGGLPYLTAMGQNYKIPTHFVPTALQFAGGSLTRANPAVGVSNFFTLSFWINAGMLTGATPGAKQPLFTLSYPAPATEGNIAGQPKKLELSIAYPTAATRALQLSAPKVTSATTTKTVSVPNPKMKEVEVNLAKRVPDVVQRSKMIRGKIPLPAGVYLVKKKTKHSTSFNYYEKVPEGPTTQQVTDTVYTLGADVKTTPLANSGWQHVVLHVDPRSGKSVLFHNSAQKFELPSAHLQGLNLASSLTLGAPNLSGTLAEVQCYQNHLLGPDAFAVKDTNGTFYPILPTSRVGFNSFYLTGSNAANIGLDQRVLASAEANQRSNWTVTGAVRQATGSNIVS